MAHIIIIRSLVIALLLSLPHVTAAAAADNISNTPKNDNKVVRIDLHPVSSHIRRLEHELQRLHHNDEQQRGVDDNNNEPLLHHHHLRHLNQDDGRWQKNMTLSLSLRHQLEMAQKAMEGRSAAYAPLMEFPYDDASFNGNDDDDDDEEEGYHDNHHVRYLKEYHNAIHQFNERYRRYSRHEWALRRETDSMATYEYEYEHEKDDRMLSSQFKEESASASSSYFLFSKQMDDTIKGRMGNSSNPASIRETDTTILSSSTTTTTTTLHNVDPTTTALGTTTAVAAADTSTASVTMTASTSIDGTSSTIVSNTTTTTDASDAPDTTNRQITTPSQLLQTNWQAIQMIRYENNVTNDDDTTTMYTTPIYRITLSIDDEDSSIITGETGCNYYKSSILFGSFSLDNNNNNNNNYTTTTSTNNDTTNNVNDILTTIQIGSLATTRRACEIPRMQQERDYVNLIQYSTFQIEMIHDDGEMIFRNVDSGQVIVRFMEIPYVREFDDEIMMMGTTTTTSSTSTTAGTSTIITSTTADATTSIATTTTTTADVSTIIATTNDATTSIASTTADATTSIASTTADATTSIASTTPTTTAGIEDSVSLAGTDWQAIDIGYNSHDNSSIELRPILQNHPITLSFDEQGRIGGKSGCNSYGGEVWMNTTDSTFTLFGPLMSTEMYCFGDGVMEQEYAYHRIFEDDGTSIYYEVIEEENGTELMLWSSREDEVEGELVATFALLVPLERRRSLQGESSGDYPVLTNTTSTDIAIVGTEWTASEFAVFKNSSTSAIEMHHVRHQDHPIIIGFESLTRIYGNSGCNNYFSLQATLSANRLDVGGVATTRMMCSEDDVMEQERDYTTLLSERSFFYRVLMHMDEEDELLLSQVMSLEDGSEVEGQVLARFVKSDSVVSAVGEMPEPMERTLNTDVKKKGGLFNAYQTTPVHQGYGTHFATMWVGTPPQRKSVIIDTGSHYTAFPCKGCSNCGEEHHTDAYFDPDLSSTFHALTCGECQSASCAQGKCLFSQSYTEGSSWHAFEAVDVVFLGGRDPQDATNPVHNSFKTDFLFGCQVKETGLFVTQLADGIMGMSAHPTTLPKIMYDQERIEHNMFSICFRRELHVSKRGILAGMLTLGGLDTRADLTPMVYARNVAATGWFTVFVKNVYIREQGGQSAAADSPNQKTQRVNGDLFQMNSGKGVIVDSGTTDTYLHRSIAGPFNEIWQKVTGRKYSNKPVALSHSDLLMLPTVLIQLAAYDDEINPGGNDMEMVTGLAGEQLDPSSPHDVILAVPATHYMEYSPSKKTYTPRLYFTESKGGVIGSNAMQRHNVLFDWENRRVGFAESTCEYDAGVEQKSDKGIVEVDCRLGQANLVTSCSETVDLSQCNQHGTAALSLSGHEVWTRVVTSPGTIQGASCEQVALATNDSGNVEVHCDGKGICKEIRECSITCANAHAAGNFGNISPTGSTATCEGATWSACDFSCSQTRINTILMTDGKCYVEKALQFTRPCHIQACGRSDPCRVPFVVHAILKIRGANAANWNKRSEEVFAEAFASTVNADRPQGSNTLFGAGDVLVLRASPWKASDDSFGDELEADQELGMQLVVETSIFNYNAVVAGGVISSEPTSRFTQAASSNINIFGRSKYAPVSSCSEADLHQLANAARDIHTALAQPNFIARVIDRIKLDEATEQMQSSSPFFTTIQDVSLAQQSSVVTSWTIKTDIGTGYSRGLDFIGSYSPRGGSVLLLLSSGVVLVYMMWTRRNQLISNSSSSARSASTYRHSNRGARYSRPVPNGRHEELNDDDAESILSLLSNTSDFKSTAGNVELVAHGDNVSVLSDLLSSR